MKILRKAYWYTTTFLSKHWLLILLAVVGGVGVFHIFFNVILGAVTQGRTTKYIGRVGNITLSSLPRDIQELVSDGLTKIGDDTEILPNLAERWSVEDDGRTYRFVMKKDLRWQDGSQVQPKDISYNFSDTQVVVTQNEIVFQLPDPFSPFPAVVSQPVFREDGNSIIGTGEYAVKEIKRDGPRIEEITLESGEDRRVYRFYPTEERALIAFKRGEVDYLEEMSDVTSISDWKNARISEHIAGDRYLGVFFNTEDPIFANKDIRQALNYALPKEKGEERALTPIRPQSWAYNKTVKTYEYDASRAIELLLRSIPGQKMDIELTSTTNFLAEAEHIKRYWEEVGDAAQIACQESSAITQKELCGNLDMKVQLRIVAFPDLSDFQVVLVGQQSAADPDQYGLWHSTQNTNFMRYKSPRVDKLLEDGRKTVNQEERKALYLDFQQFLTEDTPAIFLRHLKSFTVERT